MRNPRARCAAAAAVAAIAAVPAAAIDFFDERLEIHGSIESQVRALNPDLDHEWDLAMWKQLVALEIETTLIDWEPIGPLERLSTFVRIEASYDCVWTHACELFPSANAYGDRAEKPSSEYTDGRRNGFVGDDPAVNPVNEPLPYHLRPPQNLEPVPPVRARTDRLIGIGDTPPFEILARNQSFETAFAPVLDYRFAVRQDHVTTSFGDSSGVDATVLLVRPKDEVQHVGTLAGVPNVSFPTLPYRPAQAPIPGSGLQPQGLFTPSPALRAVADRYDIGSYEQNFSQRELALNFGASQQDEYVLREAYADLDLFEARLFVRAGKQTIVWGKTELFRNQDQFNPSDLAITTLPGLEESRIPQWAVRAIYSFYDVGPLMDVRLEGVWMLDDFQPDDVGRCGEPFAPLPVCAKTFGIFEHGLLGVGLAGERRPPNWWESWEGHEVGGRLEFRWDRFSFAISDFLHWEDQAHPEILHAYTRRVDPASGRPLAFEAPAEANCPTGLEPGCLQPGNAGPDNAFAQTPQNRQLFDVICASSVGFFALDPSVCALTITNSLAPLPFGGGAATLAQLVSATAAANPTALTVVGLLTGSAPPAIPVNQDPCDVFNDDCVALGGGAGTPAPGAGFFAAFGPTLQSVLTDQQEALVGCGAYYQSSCDTDGIDLFNTEASVLFQSWPGARPDTAVATRFDGAGAIVIPGARGPADPGYDPLVDGCVGPQSFAIDPDGHCDDSNVLIDPRTGQQFRSEMAALSYNALLFVVALDLAEGAPGCAYPVGPNPENTPTAPLDCPTVQDFFSVTALTRPDLRAGGNGRFGRRDFVWAGAGALLLEYERVNTVGFAMDFAEDRTKTNWGLELSWTADKTFTDSESPDLTSESDLFALTISVDRPTFVRFLNNARTFFFNMQWFFEYIPDHVGRGSEGSYRGFFVEGPFTALGTLTAETAYFQDRLVARATGVYDVKSESGGALLSLQYRYTANFSVTVGANHFYGSDRVWRLPIGLGALGESSQTYETERLTRLNAVKERDEVFLVFRYAF